VPGESGVIACGREVPANDAGDAEYLAYHALPDAVCGCNTYDYKDDDIESINELPPGNCLFIEIYYIANAVFTTVKDLLPGIIGIIFVL